MPPFDDLIHSLTQSAGEMASTTLTFNAVQPDRAAEARRDEALRQRTNFPYPIFNAQSRTLAEIRDRIDRTSNALQLAPSLRPVLADPHAYERMSDDLDSMARIADALDPSNRPMAPAQAAQWESRYGTLRPVAPPAPTVWNAARGVWENFRAGNTMLGAWLQQTANHPAPFVDSMRRTFDPAYAVSQAILPSPQIPEDNGPGLLDRISTALGGQPSFDRNLREGEEARVAAQMSDPAFTSWWGRAIYSGLSSTAQQAPGLVASILFRNPAPSLALAGAQQASSAYFRYRARGATDAQAQYGATLEGGIEIGTEIIPMSWFVNKFGRVGFGEFIAGLLGREIPSEELATFTQDAVDTAIANPTQTWGDYLRSRPDAFVQTAVSTIVQSLLMGSPGALIHTPAEAANREAAGMRSVDATMQAAAESKLRAELPQEFRQVVEQVAQGSHVENIYVPAEAVRELFQTPEEMSHDPFWGRYADQVEEASVLHGDVVIPIADAATHLAGTPQWEQLREQVRATPGGESQAEMRAAQQQPAPEDARRVGEDVAAQLEAERAALEPIRRLRENIMQKLIAAGYRTEAATQMADLFAQRQAARAQRLGRALTGDEASLIEVRSGVPLGQTGEEGRVLAQTHFDGPRGRITIASGGPAVIDLSENRNLSTFIHENGHLFLEELRADAEQATRMDTPEARQLFADWEAVKAWFAKHGHDMTGAEIPTDAHELFARGFERYVMEGKAPSSALRTAFAAFRSWLLTIYRHVANLRAPINPEIRDVMARLLATDEEIAMAREEQGIRALFKSADEAGMTQAEFKAYEKAANEARDEAYDALLYRTMAPIRAAREEAWSAERKSVRAEVTQEIDEQPLFKALRLLRTGQIGDETAQAVRLDRQFLIDTYGEDALRRMPATVPPVYGTTNTANADEIAERVGFPSGDAMIRAMMAYEDSRKKLREAGDKRSPRTVAIEAETDSRMAQRHGDPLHDGSIEEEARALIHNDRQGEVIASELRALARKRRRASDPNQGALPYEIARRWARDKIAGGRVAEVISGAALQQYERAARKAGEAAERAILKGDVDEAYRQKQAQMLNTALISEARKAKDAVDAAVGRMRRIATRRTMRNVDQDYLDQAHGLLEEVDFRTRSQRDVTAQESFEAWAAQQRSEGRDIIVPDNYAATLGRTHWTRLSVEQIKGLDDTVAQVIHLGRLKQTLLDGQRRRAFDDVVREAQDSIGKLPPKAPSDLMEPSFFDRIKSNVASIDGALLKLETIFDWLDREDPNGVFNRIVFRPIADAQNRENAMLADYYGRIREAMSAVPKEVLGRWTDRVTIPELPNRETGNPFTFTRQQLVSLALNMGNDGNIQRMTEGYGWREENVMAALNRELTAEEWHFVQAVWDILDSLYPDIADLERRVNGFSPEKVEARPLETSAGTLKGGYYPVIYDSARNVDAERQAARAGDLFEATYTKATTRAGSANERANRVQRPVLLQLGVINRHLGEVIHDITHREAVINAEKFLSDRRVVAAVDNSLGPEIRRQFRPWLKFVANSWAMERSGNEGLGKFVNKARSNATVVGMGWRITTIMNQFAGYSNSFEYVGARWVAPAIAQASAHPIETYRFVTERSGEVRDRMMNLDRDIRLSIRQMAGQSSPIASAKRFAFYGIGIADRMVVIPTWIGAYNRALSEGMTDENAIYFADKAVRKSQGAGSPKDLAAIQRGTGKWGELLRLSTMFYSYFSAYYQRERTLGRDVATAVRERDMSVTPRLLARAWWLIIVPPLLSDLLSGRGPDDGEDWGLWALRNMLVNIFGPIPFARDVIDPIWRALAGMRVYDYQLSPVQRAGESMVNVAKDAGRAARGEETRRPVRDILEATGYATGLVPGQVASATQFLVDVGNGEQDPQTLADWYQGLTHGRIPER